MVPTFEYRFYFDATHWRTGVAFLTDRGIKIFNYPDQTHENGVVKNIRTAKTYKRTIRILKRLRNKMQEENIAAAHDVGSFLIESLVWNVPDNAFAHDAYTSVVRDVLAHTFNNTLDDASCQDWLEVNDCKYLFRAQQPWTRLQAHAFLSAAWNYIGYE